MVTLPCRHRSSLGLFKAAVGVVGVYDFRLLYSEGDVRGRFCTSLSRKTIGQDEAEFRAYSPVFRADELKAPVMMIQGEKDERAPVEHSDVMAKVLEEIGHPHEYIVLPNEDRRFYKPENRIRYFELFSSFLSKHLLNSRIQSSSRTCGIKVAQMEVS